LGETPFIGFLRYGIYKVFGTHRLTQALTHSFTHGPTDPNTVTAPFFNDGGSIINARQQSRPRPIWSAA